MSSERVISDDLKSKIQEWNRADSALFDAVNAEFWKKVKDYGFDKMQIEIKELHARIDELMEFCVAGKTSFVPKWSEAAIELGCQNQNQTNASHNCFFLNSDTLVLELCFDRRRSKIRKMSFPDHG